MACFQAQQAGEKALKALWYFHAVDPWGHSLLKLMREFPIDDVRQNLVALNGLARQLDKLYVPTRYPNGLPDLTPAEVYADDDARAAIEAARTVIDTVETMVAWRPAEE